MAVTTVASLLNRAAVVLQDPTNIRWPQSELLDWLNDGQREIALFKPNVFVKNIPVQLVAGTKQALPADGVSLIDVVRNMGTNGSTPGDAIRVVTREILDAQIKNWHSSTASATAKHYVYTPLDPKTFYVYPPQPSTGMNQVEIIYVASPTDATLVSTITIDDIYMTALLNYILFRAYTKDAEYANNAQLATAYYTQFQAIMQGKTASEVASNPNASLGGFNPNLPGGTK
ncbi:MAG: hypothetical protein RJA99_3188 [Pseudomonadota bacterium]|jgi:hypothetical protein